MTSKEFIESVKEQQEREKKEEQLHAVTYAYVPKEGFDWDNVSGGI